MRGIKVNSIPSAGKFSGNRTQHSLQLAIILAVVMV